jgi:hypothetical protein
MIHEAKRVAFAAAVAVALGFGAAQALAQPAHARACSDQTCATVCSALGFHGGFCNTGGGCSCYL